MPIRYPLTRPRFDQHELELLSQCLESGWVTQGPFTARFETLFAERHRAPHALATTSCTAALHLAAIALGLGPGDEVIVPAFTWITSAHAAEYVGAKAVFADIDPATFNLSPDAVRAAITPRTRAIVAVHLFGLAAPMDELLDLAQRHDLRVIEDAACAVGTEYGGRPVGTLGDIGCFSFHPRKVITTGEGGMLTTRDATLAARLRSLRNHGAVPRYAAGDPRGDRPWSMSEFPNLGFNLRLSDVQAAVGVAQMAKLDALLEDRARCAARYGDALKGRADLALPGGSPRERHTYQSYVVRVVEGGERRRNAVMEILDAKGIQTRPGTHAVHRLGYYRERYSLRSDAFPQAAAAEDTTITLPIFPGMTEADLGAIVDTLVEALGSVA